MIPILNTLTENRARGNHCQLLLGGRHPPDTTAKDITQKTGDGCPPTTDTLTSQHGSPQSPATCEIISWDQWIHPRKQGWLTPTDQVRKHHVIIKNQTRFNTHSR